MLHKSFVLFLTVLLAIPFNVYPFSYENMDVKVHASISELYNDNITYREDNEIDDFITDLTFGLGIGYQGKTSKFDLLANINQQIFADNDDFNNTSEDLTLDFSHEFSKYDRISLRDVFTHTYEPRSFEEAFGRSTGRYSYYRNRFNLAYEKDLAKQLSLRARYTNEIDEPSRDDLSDSSLHGGGLEAVYFPSSANILLFSYDFTQREFDPGSNATTHSIAAGIRHYFTEQLYFDGKAGIDLIDSYADTDYSKPLIQAALTSDIDENTRASISFAKKYYTNAYSQDLFDYWQASVNFVKQIFKRLKLSLSGFYGEGEYIEANVTDKLSGVSTGLSYDLSEKSTVSLNYTYSQVESTINSREYAKNTVMLKFTFRF